MAQVTFNMLQEKDLTHDLRANRNVIKPKCNTVSYGTNSFMYKGAKIWNNLPNELKNCISLEQFKKMIKKWNSPKCYCQMCMRLLTL